MNTGINTEFKGVTDRGIKGEAQTLTVTVIWEPGYVCESYKENERGVLSPKCVKAVITSTPRLKTWEH